MPSSEGQKTAQREIATALETALDARRQRIIISQSQVNLLKWSCLFMQAVCALVAIAMVHSDNRLASIIAMGIFATGVAASMLLILAHDRPFTGEISIKPDPLLQVMPEISNKHPAHRSVHELAPTHLMDFGLAQRGRALGRRRLMSAQFTRKTFG